MTAPLLEAEGLARDYGAIRALDGVSFAIETGKTLAVVGESGSGKSTLGRLVALLEAPTRGVLSINGKPLAARRRSERRDLRRQIQMIFQNPYGSLNPRKTVAAALEEPLTINTALSRPQRRAAAIAMLQRVGLSAEHADRYPHMFSGGQRQRVAIARALMLEPRLVVADEPVSALDLSIQAQIVTLMLELQQSLGLAYLFISHDLALVRHVADDLLVLYLGRTVEQGPAALLLAAPLHPYTRALIASRPRLGEAIPPPVLGEAAPPRDIEACAFHPRCPFAVARCRVEAPSLRAFGTRLVACHRADELIES